MTLWTPGGERSVPRAGDAQPSPGPPPPSEAPAAQHLHDPDLDEPELSREEIEQLQRQLAATPPEVVIANHCYGLFELAALHLSLQPPQLPQARLAIDALAALVEGLEGRLGDPEPHLRDGLSQLRLAFVQLQSSVDPPTSE